MWGDDNVTTSMNIEANISKRKYEVFVRKVESPKEETKFRGFLNTNLNANTEGWIYVWVILGAKDIKEANESFKNFIKDKSIRDSKKDNAIKNDPIVIKEKAAGGDMVVLMRTVREIKYKSGAGALLHPAEEYFVERATTTTTH